jgi:hypothetical protein
MTAPGGSPRTRRCEGCGYRFVLDGDQWYCSAICAGQACMASVIAAVQQFAEGGSPSRLATQFVITGDRPTINYSPQHATVGGMNVTVGTPAPGLVTVSGAYGTAIDSQAANGANSSVVGSQANTATTTPSPDGTPPTPAPRSSPRKRAGGARLRKRGMVVAFTTIIGGIAAAAAVVVAAVFAWIGWTPWS